MAICFLSIKIIDRLLSYFEDKMVLSLKAKDIVSSTLIESLKGPIKVFYWIFCFYRIFVLFDEDFIFSHQLKALLIAMMALWVSLRFIPLYTQRVVEIKQNEKRGVDFGRIGFLKKISQTLVITVISIITLEKIGIKLNSVIAIGGIGGMAIGFAAKDMLANIFGGLVLHLDKPFTVGDVISLSGKGIEGVTAEIGWRQTKITSFAKTSFFIPNSVFSSMVVENKSRFNSRRIEEIIPIKYVEPDVVEKIINSIRDMLDKSEFINRSLDRVVALDKIDRGLVLNIGMTVFVRVAEWAKYMEIRQKILLDTIRVIRKNGGDLARVISYHVNVDEEKFESSL
jgi:MscS family membrane protein